MKKALAAIFCAIALGVIASPGAWSGPSLVERVIQSVGGESLTLKPACGIIEEKASGTLTYVSVGNASDRIYAASTFTGNGSTIRTVYVSLRRATGGGQDATLSICTNSSGAPSTTCTSADAVIPASSLTTSFSDKKVNFAAGYATAAAATYWLVVSVPTANATVYDPWQYDSAGTGSVRRSADGITWGSVDPTAQALFKITSCLE